jgi:hypothetical protein
MRKSGILILIFLTAGCMQLQMLPYLDQALTLQALGREKDEQNKFAKNVDAKFEKLLAAIDSGEIKQYKTQKDIIRTFGPPILAHDDQIDGKPVKRVLYRYAIQSQGPKKVYLYYDPSGQLMKWERI